LGTSFSSFNAVNTIFWDNLNSQIGIEDGGPPTVSYCDVQGGYTGTGNIDCDPMFCDTTNFNYYLDYSSCCVGGGQGGADIGAFEAGCNFPGIINIPADFPTIQQGIDSSISGDTILVQPGTYTENINFSGKNIIVASLFLTTQDTSYIDSTIIDGGSAGSVVTIESGEDSTAVITGFTIQNGNYIYGGGVYCDSTQPIIEYNIIRSNYADAWYAGGGIMWRRNIRSWEQFRHYKQHHYPKFFREWGRFGYLVFFFQRCEYDILG
jgi:hypothetical protein